MAGASSRDLIAALRDKALIAAGPRAPQPGAPIAHVTTERFLEIFGLETLGDLPELAALKDAGWVMDAEPSQASPVGGDEDIVVLRISVSCAVTMVIPGSRAYAPRRR